MLGRWTMAAVFALVCGGAQAQSGYCASLLKVLAQAPNYYTALRTGEPEFRIKYQGSVTLSGAEKCMSWQGSSGGTYTCRFRPGEGPLKAQWERLIAQTSACFGHTYKKEPWDAPESAILNIDRVDGRYSVRERSGEQNAWATIFITLNERAKSGDALIITFYGKPK